MEYKIEKKTGFFKRFYPSYIYEKVEDIPYELIQKENIKLIILDMDNTLIDNNRKFNKELKAWIKNMKDNKIQLCILSNSPFGDKVREIATKLNMSYEFNATKPLLRGFKKVIERNDVKIENILMIGDQIFTDIWGGNRFGVKTILVTPINKSESVLSRVKRPLERIILKKYKAEGDNK